MLFKLTSRLDMSATKNLIHLNHARHNEEACACLKECGHWDWVVTTAFYASLHYVHYEIFPLDSHDTLNGYYGAKYPRGRGPSKHAVISRLVKKHLSGATAAYNALKDAAFTSRYDNYQTTEAEAKAAISRLDLVKMCCKEISSKPTGTGP